MRFRVGESIIDIRISEVKMQKTNDKRIATNAHRKVTASTTLNRKYVKRPMKSADVMVSVKRSPKIQRFSSERVVQKKVDDSQSVELVKSHPVQAVAINRMQNRKTVANANKITAKELKDQAIKKALANVSKTDIADHKGTDNKKSTKIHFGIGRVVLALSCATVAVFAIVYFVNLNMPDISMRVAAMQTGIEATYPGYVPRGFNLSDITSEEGKVSLKFKSAETDDEFYLIEENSSWDSNALLNNFVKGEYGEDYSIIREQGLTIYISNSDATWVNGGIVYKIKTTAGSLSKKQIRSIAVSL